jgi:hypothetical protein
VSAAAQALIRPRGNLSILQRQMNQTAHRAVKSAFRNGRYSHFLLKLAGQFAIMATQQIAMALRA